MAQKAWSFVNDCHQTVSVLCFPPNVIASAAIYFAACELKFPLPALEWWKVFGANLEDIKYVCADVMNLFEMERIDGVTV
mmetsp:Transcript_48815/g.35930  ORF Transcript_48815/g.35930 Transcript_48815/m.35930 type:complete len:80 (+) Transcript_48815:773-1012(+)|eukprot:CAMPEP_0202963342 /NCGR_PEP_ID=MMETSP1396-20130829/7331_1 /ASSEMBLY_ACC=CAM_ASM_000872 /TAXON_ID= /ORGANISM="Pseudokeronopsis sp., Strain Brazil" /LENGTH=79 /DNA_ID=CAMNT_0049684469 /DNA_START=773 /DNA_END=1012 /DNA_ORIENTATION=-